MRTPFRTCPACREKDPTVAKRDNLGVLCASCHVDAGRAQVALQAARPVSPVFEPVRYSPSALRALGGA